MSAGKGFSRRVTLANLHSFSPLLKKRRVHGTGGNNTSGDDVSEHTSDTANQGVVANPELAAVETLFSGESFKTGVRFRRLRSAHAQPAPAPARSGRSPRVAARSTSLDVLLMRVRPRRNGKQMQISMILHRSSFMRRVAEVYSAADGSPRGIGYDKVKKTSSAGKATRKKNQARFEAPEMSGMKNPVARFRWVDIAGPQREVRRILQYEVYDADKDSEGKKILATLEQGIATPPMRDMRQLGRLYTVLTTNNRQSAQWYRLVSA